MLFVAHSSALLMPIKSKKTGLKQRLNNDQWSKCAHEVSKKEEHTYEFDLSDSCIAVTPFCIMYTAKCEHIISKSLARILAQQLLI